MHTLRLQVPDELMAELQRVADKHGIETLDVIKKSIRLALLIDKVEGEENAAFILRDGDTEREVTLV